MMFFDAEISISGYDLFRCDRKDRSHGGVAVYVRKDLVVKSIMQESNSFCDSLVLHLPQLNLVLINVYRSPSCPETLFSENLETIRNYLNTMENKNQCAQSYLLVGDFNFPFLKVGRDSTTLKANIGNKSSSEKKQAQSLLDFTNEFFMEQYVRKPTRGRNVLDLVFTNDHFLIHNYSIIVNSSLSDHNTICINLSIKETSTPEPQQQKNYYFSKIAESNLKEADEEDWYRLNLLLNQINWDSILEELSPEESLNKFVSVLEENVDIVFKKQKHFQNGDKEQIEKKKFKSNNKIPRPIRKLMRNKCKLSKSMLKTKSCSKYLQIKDSIEEIESKLKESYSSRRMEKERSAIQRMKKDPAYFFNYAKKFAKTKSEVGPFIDDQGDLVSKKEDIVNMLKSQYESVYSTPDVNMKVEQPEEFFQHSEANEQLDSVVFDRMDVLEALGKLSNKSSPGPDGIPSILLKKCRYGIVDGLLIVFQKIFSSGNIPVALKTAFVIPIHKGGSRASPVNFRPVSLTSHIIKTLERVIRVSLVRHLELHEKINPNQHGFRHQRSCLSHLLAHHDQILSYLEEGHNVDSVYLDFSKAFDKVDIGILCHKLRDLGIHGKLGQWIHNFLTSREQYIVVNGTVSNVSHVTSGVPQ